MRCSEQSSLDSVVSQAAAYTKQLVKPIDRNAALPATSSTAVLSSTVESSGLASSAERSLQSLVERSCVAFMPHGVAAREWQSLKLTVPVATWSHQRLVYGRLER